MRMPHAAARIAVIRHERYWLDQHLRRDVRALRDAGFDVDVICNYEPGRPRLERVDGITIFRMPFVHKRGSLVRYLFEYAGFAFVAAVFVAFLGLFRRYRFVEVRNLPDWLVFASVGPKLLGAKASLYMYENMPELVALDHDLGPEHLIVRALVLSERLCARIADCLIAPHEMARRILIRQGIPPAKIVVVPNVPDESVFFSHLTGEDGPVESKEHIPDFHLVTHGSLLERYGIQTLIEAVQLVRPEIPGLRLSVIGDGEYRPALESLTDRLGLSDIVTFTGLVSFDRVAPLLAGADVGVVPMWADFVPNKLMEYLALGLPAITTDSAALRLYFDDQAVRYVPAKNARALADALNDLYRNPECRHNLARTGNEVFRRRFSWERTRWDYLAIYGVKAEKSPATSKFPQRCAAAGGRV